jgi:hypothetical protein
MKLMKAEGPDGSKCLEMGTELISSIWKEKRTDRVEERE